MHDLDRALMELEHEGQRGFGGGFADDFSGEFEGGDGGFGDTEMAPLRLGHSPCGGYRAPPGQRARVGREAFADVSAGRIRTP